MAGDASLLVATLCTNGARSRIELRMMQTMPRCFPQACPDDAHFRGRYPLVTPVRMAGHGALCDRRRFVSFTFVPDVTGAKQRLLMAKDKIRWGSSRSIVAVAPAGDDDGLGVRLT